MVYFTLMPTSSVLWFCYRL